MLESTGDIVLGTKSGKLYKSSLCDLKCTELLSSSHCGAITDVTFLLDSNEAFFATCSDDGFVRIYSTNDYSVTMEACVPGVSPSNVVLTEDCLISAWRDGRIRCHGVVSGDLLWSIHDAHVGGGH